MLGITIDLSNNKITRSRFTRSLNSKFKREEVTSITYSLDNDNGIIYVTLNDVEMYTLRKPLTLFSEKFRYVDIKLEDI